MAEAEVQPGASERWPLIGRSEELALLDDQVGERAGSMVLAGAVGVGKSRLLAGWLAGLEARGRPTVVVRATRSTATIPFGAFARWVPEPPGDSRDRLGILQATAARLARLGSGVVVAVDDAHLLDDGSAALVLHLAQHTPSGVVLTVRSGEPCPDAVVALWKEQLAVRLDLQPLSEPETAELLERVLGDSLAVAAQRRLWTLSQGNPLYLREVVEAGRAQGVLAHSRGQWRWRGTFAGGTRLVELVSDRVGSRGSGERRVLEIVALGEPLPLDVLARLAPGAVLAELENQGLLVTERLSPQDTGQVVRLAHPLYSEVLRAELPPFTAQAHHRTLAEAALATGAEQRDPLRVATWLLGSGEEVVDHELLLRAAYLALIIDDYELALRLAKAAEDAGAGWKATLRRAQALGPLQRWDEADALLSTVLTGDDPDARAEAARIRAEQSFWYRGTDLASTRAAVLDATEVADPPARSPLLAQQALLAIVDLELEDAIRLATLAAANATTPSDRLNAVGCAGIAALLLGRTRDAMAVVDLAAPYALEAVYTDPVAGACLAFIYSHAVVLEGRIDEAADLFAFLAEQDIVRMGGPARALPTYFLARAELARGHIGTAVRRCREAWAVVGTDTSFQTGAWIAATLATAAAQAGDTEIAASALQWLDRYRRMPIGPDAAEVRLARAWLTAAGGELSAASTLALDIARDAGERNVPVLELAALLDATRLGAARIAAPRLEELAGVVEGPHAEVVARFAGALAADDGAALDEVASRFAVLGARLLAAEAAAAAATAHGEAGQRRAQAASLACAQRLASECEGAATPLIARLDHTPVATALTDREREVIELAARGCTSREIAETLIISVRTVDSHLNHAYTKLGISDRRELAAVLGRRRPTPAR